MSVGDSFRSPLAPSLFAHSVGDGDTSRPGLHGLEVPARAQGFGDSGTPARGVPESPHGPLMEFLLGRDSTRRHPTLHSV